MGRRTAPILMPDLDSLPDHALLTQQQLHKLTGFALITLRVWASKNIGPKITRINGSLPRYSAKDVREWLSQTPKGGGNVVPLTTPEQAPPPRKSTQGLATQATIGKKSPQFSDGPADPSDVMFLVETLKSAIDDLLAFRRFGATARCNLQAAESKIDDVASRVMNLVLDDTASRYRGDVS
jgi:hypothetical protein